MDAWQKVLALLPPDLITSPHTRRLLPLLGRLGTLRKVLNPSVVATIGLEAAWQQLTQVLQDVVVRDRSRIETAILTFWDALRTAFNHPMGRARAAEISVAIVDALRASRQPLLDWLQQPEHLDQLLRVHSMIAPYVKHWFEKLAAETLLGPET